MLVFSIGGFRHEQQEPEQQQQQQQPSVVASGLVTESTIGANDTSIMESSTQTPPPLRLPHRAPLLARQDQGLRFGGGKHWSEARFARFRPTLTGPNTKPQSWLAAVTIPTFTCTLTLTLTLTLKH